MSGTSDTDVVEPNTLAAYEAVAPYYDTLTDNPGYLGWVTHLRDMVERHGAPGRRLVDLGCGTGRSSAQFAAMGYRVTGMDLSPAMIEVARAKPDHDTISFQVGDLRDLPVAGPFDVATCIGEPLNYLADTAELTGAYRGVHRILAPGGLFLFEMNTVRAYRLSAATAVHEAPGIYSVRHCLDTEEFQAGGCSHIVFDTFLADRDDPADRWRRSTSCHVQRHFTEAEVRRCLAAAGLELLSLRGLRRGVARPLIDQDQDITGFYAARRAGHDLPEGGDYR